MKKVTLFYLPGCPFCNAADRWINEVQNEHPELKQLEIERIDERRQAALANRYDYWYVPTFYINGCKEHEGACSKQIVERVLLGALQQG